MLLFLITLDHHIVNIHLHYFFDLLFEHSCNHLLVSCSNILQTKRHYRIVVIAFRGDKNAFSWSSRARAIKWYPWNASRKLILRWPYVAPMSRSIFKTGNGSLGHAIFANPIFPIFLLHNHSICQPVREKYLFYRSSLLQLFHLFPSQLPCEV